MKDMYFVTTYGPSQGERYDNAEAAREYARKLIEQERVKIGYLFVVKVVSVFDFRPVETVFPVPEGDGK